MIDLKCSWKLVHPIKSRLNSPTGTLKVREDCLRRGEIRIKRRSTSFRDHLPTSTGRGILITWRKCSPDDRWEVNQKEYADDLCLLEFPREQPLPKCYRNLAKIPYATCSGKNPLITCGYLNQSSYIGSCYNVNQMSLQPHLPRLCNKWCRRARWKNKSKLSQSKKATNPHTPVPKIKTSVNINKSEIVWTRL